MNRYRTDALLAITDPRIGLDPLESDICTRLWRARTASFSVISILTLAAWFAAAGLNPGGRSVSNSNSAPGIWMLPQVVGCALLPVAILMVGSPTCIAVRLKGRRSVRGSVSGTPPRFGIRLQRALFLAYFDTGFAGLALSLTLPVPVYMLSVALIMPGYGGTWSLYAVMAWCAIWIANTMRLWYYAYRVTPKRYAMHQCIACGYPLPSHLRNHSLVFACPECGTSRRCERAVDRTR